MTDIEQKPRRKRSSLKVAGAEPKDSVMVEPPALDPRYFQEAISWEQDVIRSVKRSRAIAWSVALASTMIAITALLCLALLLPLKTFEPYVIEVDKTTGYLEVKRALKPTAEDPAEAVTAMNIVRYLRARETYDPLAIKDNFDLTELLATGTAARDLVELYSPANPKNPVRLYGRTTQISVFIKSVQFPNNRTAIVRFSTTETGQTNIVTSHWTSLIRFRYTDAPMKNEWRFDNPLGFQVTEYRRDQESASTTEPAPASTAPLPAPDLAPADQAVPAPAAPVTGSTQ
jgi:type IV secretion system protein VirB8